MAPRARRLGRSATALAVALAGVACSDDGSGRDAGDGSTARSTGAPAGVETSSAAAAPIGSPSTPSMPRDATSTEATVTPASTATASSASAPAGRPACDVPDALLAERAGGTILDAVAAIGSLSTLADTVDAAGLTERIAGRPAPFTLFAPTNEAFEALDPDELDTLLASPAALVGVLTLHVVPDTAATIDDLTTVGSVASATGAPLVVTIDDGLAVVAAGGQAGRVSCPDIAVANGVLHLIDAVLLPPPVDTQAVGGSRLYTVDGDSGEAALVGGFGSELGVLGVAATPEGDLVAVTDGLELISFSPTDPAAISARVPISGVDGATLLAVDTRPGVGELLAFSDAGVLYSIERASGAATPVGDGLDPPLDDPGFGFDVGVAGDVRVVVATGTSVRIDASTGAVSATDPPPAFAAGDINEDVAPRVVALASAPNGDPLVVDAATTSLSRLGDDGTLTTIGPLDVTLTDGASLDVAQDGTIYLTVPG